MNSVMFNGGESTGSIAKQNLNTVNRNNPLTPPPIKEDVVNFRGRSNYDESPSVISKVAKLAVFGALTVAGLGYAHKTNAVGKLKDGKVKDFLKKSDVITEPCHKACSTIKNAVIEFWNKVKNMFGGKKA